MHLTGSHPREGTGPLAACHPLARIGAALLVMLALFLSRGITGPAVACAAIGAAALASGLDLRVLARRAAPVLLSAAGIGTFNSIVTGDPAAGVAVALRLAGIALAGSVALATVDPTDLADALVQHLRAPPRFVIGTLAALRLVPLFAREWELRGLARRARGFDDDRVTLARLRSFPGRTHGLLVAAIRRATALALAMDARGFGTRTCRTLSRPSDFDRADGLLLGGGLVLALVVIA